MLNKKQRMLESIVKSLSISVSDLTSQVELLRKELMELKGKNLKRAGKK